MPIFGIGLPKTGTVSASHALNKLGIRSIHNPVDTQTMAELASGNYHLTVLQHFDAIFDLPASCFYREYDLVHPNSQFILTTRQLDSWLQSCEHWWNTVLRIDSTADIRRVNAASNNSAVFLKLHMFGRVRFDATAFTKVYRQRELEIADYFKDKLHVLCTLPIEMPGEEKWQTLCKFLDKPVPHIPYPHANKRQVDV